MVSVVVAWAVMVDAEVYVTYSTESCDLSELGTCDVALDVTAYGFVGVDWSLSYAYASTLGREGDVSSTSSDVVGAERLMGLVRMLGAFEFLYASTVTGADLSIVCGLSWPSSGCLLI